MLPFIYQLQMLQDSSERRKKLNMLRYESVWHLSWAQYVLLLAQVSDISVFLPQGMLALINYSCSDVVLNIYLLLFLIVAPEGITASICGYWARL